MFEVTVIGGGVMGAATACFLARDHGARVTVVERDPSYAQASSSLSLSSIRQQFSQPANIALSRWSLDFLRRVGEELATDDDVPAIGLVEPGYLYLATAAGAPLLQSLNAVQRAHGADVALLAPAQIAARFPWLAVDDLALGSLGLSGEGWFDGPALHRAFRRKARACGCGSSRPRWRGLPRKASASPPCTAPTGSAWAAMPIRPDSRLASATL